jgi:hypothetical protein
MRVALELDPTACPAVAERPPDDRPDDPQPRVIERKGFEEIDGNWVEKPAGNPAVTIGGSGFGFIRDSVRPRKFGRILGSDVA